MGQTIDDDRDHYDDETLEKVRGALKSSPFVRFGHETEVISALQNAGILFRERKTQEG